MDKERLFSVMVENCLVILVIRCRFGGGYIFLLYIFEFYLNMKVGLSPGFYIYTGMMQLVNDKFYLYNFLCVLL